MVDAIGGLPVDGSTTPVGYVSLVDWPGCSFWPDQLKPAEKLAELVAMTG